MILLSEKYQKIHKISNCVRNTSYNQQIKNEAQAVNNNTAAQDHTIEVISTDINSDQADHITDVPRQWT